MEVELTRAERERLEQYAEAHGLTLEQAVIHAARAELERRYRLPTRPGRVMNLESLKRDRSSR